MLPLFAGSSRAVRLDFLGITADRDRARDALAKVFAITQVTLLLADDPAWGGMLLLAALWWAWSVYARLTSATDVD